MIADALLADAVLADAALWAFIDLTAPVFFVLRVAAGIGAAIVGWIVTGPTVRLLYRLAFQNTAPGWIMPLARGAGGIALGLLVFYFLPLGGGSGWGWGPGEGGGPGPGPGDGSGQVVGVKDSPKEKNKDVRPPTKSIREPVEIELIGGSRYKGDEKYYLLKRQEPPLSIQDLDARFKEMKDRWEIHVVLTDDSVTKHHGAYMRLLALTREYQIPSVEPPDIEPKN